MKIVAIGSKAAFDELISGAGTIKWVHCMHGSELAQHTDANAFFVLAEDGWDDFLNNISVPCFVHSVTRACALHSTAIRFNGWTGFIKNDMWEIAGNITDAATAILSALNKRFVVTADEPGFISARIIAMIVNEAWYAIGDGISTEAEIDTAMKLGTNYPYGPFEWGHAIGMKNIYTLLQQMSMEHEKYKPAPSFEKFIQTQ